MNPTRCIRLTVWTLVLLAALCRDAATGAVVVAVDGSWQAVSNAIAAAGPGGTVWVPTNSLLSAASNQWSGTMILNKVSLMASNTVSVMLTTNDTTSGTGVYVSAFGSSVTISNFVFDVDQARGPGGTAIAVDGSNVCFRITHCLLLHASCNPGDRFGIKVGTSDQNGIAARGPFGLIDHCNFYWPGGVVYNFINVTHNGGNIGNGFGWSYTNTWGQADAVIAEDCNFSAIGDTIRLSSVMEAATGSRCVVRYCNITNSPESTHGTQSGSPGIHVSTMSLEMYMNRIVLKSADDQQTFDYLLLHRGGSAVIWSNTYINQMAANQFGVGCLGKFWLECAQTDWVGNNCSAQITDTNLYPVSQQVGQGVINNSGLQGLHPVYMWGNTWPSAANGHFIGANADVPFIQANRDVYTTAARPNYVPFPYPDPFTPAVPPSITAEPQDATYALGQATSFSLTATGDAPLTYQWKTNGTAVGGATSTSLAGTATVPGTVLVSCVVANGAGSATSRNAVMMVLTNAVTWFLPIRQQ